jgi:hypothetical protein
MNSSILKQIDRAIDHITTAYEFSQDERNRCVYQAASRGNYTSLIDACRTEARLDGILASLRDIRPAPMFPDQTDIQFDLFSQ